ncbi:MAG: hypothetical protein E4H37_04505 [Gemmatimonadales bacterium]|nr:MAG: hypothetical protein E4H37_04505 [Gemmatimonadales bacterium]
MLPDPLHPAVVHFPVVLAALLPLAAVVALILIARGAHARKTWAFVVALSAMLAAASWAAVETGQDEEDTVEKVVAEEPIHEHEEAGERMLIFSGIGVLLVGLGLANGKVGQAGRWIGTVAAVGLLVASYQVGRLGGELVYQHGAAGAYTDTLPAGGVEVQRGESEED